MNRRAPFLLAALWAGCSPTPPVVSEPTPAPEEVPPVRDCATAPVQVFELDRWGGLTAYPREATGFFRVEEIEGRWWFVSPDGGPLLVQGVNSMGPGSGVDQQTGTDAYAQTVQANYADTAAWADATVARLGEWGFNGGAAWMHSSLRGLTTDAPVLYLGGTSWLDGDIADVFDPEWALAVEERAASGVEGRVDDPSILGWFLDNEMRWGKDWRGTEDLLELTWALPAQGAGRAELMELLRARHADDFTDLATTWGFSPGQDGPADWDEWEALPELPQGGQEDREAWTFHYARRYFEVTTGAVRAVDPNHLLLGVRWIGQMTPRAVVEAAAGLIDVASVNPYTLVDGLEEILQEQTPSFVRSGEALRAVHDASGGLPVLISEFGFRARDSGLPNTLPPIQLTLDTQTERAAAFTEYAHRYLREPWMVGLQWFKWTDQPAGGRFDGENSNWGLVDSEDVPWSELTDATATQGVAWAYSCWADTLQAQ